MRWLRSHRDKTRGGQDQTCRCEHAAEAHDEECDVTGEDRLRHEKSLKDEWTEAPAGFGFIHQKMLAIIRFAYITDEEFPRGGRLATKRRLSGLGSGTKAL